MRTLLSENINGGSVVVANPMLQLAIEKNDSETITSSLKFYRNEDQM